MIDGSGCYVFLIILFSFFIVLAIYHYIRDRLKEKYPEMFKNETIELDGED